MSNLSVPLLAGEEKWPTGHAWDMGLWGETPHYNKLKGERAMPLPPAHSWSVEHTFRFLSRCDRCHRRRLFAHYFEVYGPADKDYLKSCPRHELQVLGVWWWECSLCIIDTLTELLEASRG